MVVEKAESAAKILQGLQDLPLWVFAGLTTSAAILLWIPAIAAFVPAYVRPWIVMAGVICGSLAGARAIGILIKKIPVWRASKDARRRFYLTEVPQQSHWSSAKQSDDSIVTQIVTDLLIKNRTSSPLALTRARLISPRIRG